VTPRDFGPGLHGHGEAFLVLPFLAALVLLLALLAATGLYLVRSGKLDLGRAGRSRPEEDAKRVLAERFARGDISGEEFMERSSLLNWTPGVQEAARPWRPRLRR
jgi:putative membrane protein